jgi:hypothetical protein
LLASTLKIMENVYVKHWCQIQERTQTGPRNTHLFIITETKQLSPDICEDITKNFQNNRYVRILWSEFKNEKIDININKIIKENSCLVRPWKDIYEERGLDCRQFNNSLPTHKIEKKRFSFLPTTFQSEFGHKSVAETFYIFKNLNITAFTKIEELINLCLKKTLRPNNIPNFLYINTINETKWRYRHWTIIICDKNSNLQLPMCPKQYYEDMKRTFIQNPSMFKIIINREMDIRNYEKNLLKNFQNTHKKFWSHLGRINKSGELPIAYTLPKFSDIDKKLPLCRVRPIITYAKFSMKKTLSIVAIALNYLLSMLDPSKHFDIMDTNLVKINFEKINANTPFGNFTGAISLLSDIESMFDRIEPDMVKETLEWLFLEVKKIKRTDRITVNLTERKARFGRTYDDNYEIKYDEIIDIVHYMLKNSYVKIGCQYLAIQIKGLPQGAPPSPPLARLVCIKREWQWNKNIQTEMKLYSGMRFMDDVCLLFYYHIEKPESKKVADNLRKNFIEKCYFKQWNLKQVDTNIFLSTEYKWISGKVDF